MRKIALGLLFISLATTSLFSASAGFGFGGARLASGGSGFSLHPRSHGRTAFPRSHGFFGRGGRNGFFFPGFHGFGFHGALADPDSGFGQGFFGGGFGNFGSFGGGLGFGGSDLFSSFGSSYFGGPSPSSSWDYVETWKDRPPAARRERNTASNSLLLKEGMDEEAVLGKLGSPIQRIGLAGSGREIWQYSGYSVIFESGKLKEIR